MTVKLTRRQTERHRESIRVSALITRLAKNAAGTLKTPQGEPIEMTAGQIRSAQILIDKAMPNLTSIEQTNIEEPQSRQTLQEELNQLRESLTPEDIKQLLGRVIDSTAIDVTAEEQVDKHLIQ